jgi:2-keto-4-pentenoate hydratase
MDNATVAEVLEATDGVHPAFENLRQRGLASTK